MVSKYASGGPTALRTCVICARSPGDGVKLMRCNGCVDPPTYCSKACQKAHWPVHKEYCKSMSNQELEGGPSFQSEGAYGFPCVKDLVLAFTEYLSAHRWAIEAVTKVNAFVKWGYELEKPDKAFTVFLFSRTSHAQNPSGNPAHTFMFRDEVMLDEKDERLAQISESQESGIEQFRRRCPPDTRPPDGAIFALFMLDKSEHRKLMCFPWYRPNPHEIPIVGRPPGLTTEQALKSLDGYLKDLKHICLRSLNTDLPFRALIKDVHDLQMPVPGRYKRIRKEWIWEPLFANWDEYMEGRAKCGPLPVLEGMKMNQSPERIMWCYYHL